MTSVKSQRYGPRAHSTPDFSANITPAMCRALNGEVWGSCALAGGRSSLFEGVRVAGAYDLAPLDYDAVPLYRFAVEVGLEAAANAVGVALLRVQRRAGDVRSHRVVRHRPPRVVFRRGLGVPYVAGVPGQLALFERLDEGIPVDDRPARRVDHPGAPFHVEQPLAVEQPPRRRRQGSVDADNVAQRNELVDVRVADAQDVLVDGAELRNVVVEQPDVEVLEPHGRLLPDPAHADESDGFVFEVVGLPGDLADAPAAVDHIFVSRHVVAHQGKDLHDGVLGDAGDVAAGLLRNGDVPIGRLRQVHVVGSYAGQEHEAEVRRLVHHLPSDVHGPEGCGDQDLRVLELLVEFVTLPPVRRHYQFVPLALEPVPQAQRAVRAAEHHRRLNLFGTYRRRIFRAGVKNRNNLHVLLLPVSAHRRDRTVRCYYIVSARISSVVRVTAKGHRFSVGFSEIKDRLQRRRTSENPKKAKFTSGIMHSPVPIQQIVLCRVSQVHSLTYIRYLSGPGLWGRLNFAFTAFSEVRYPLAMPRYS